MQTVDTNDSTQVRGSPRAQWIRNQIYALGYLTYYALVQEYSRAVLGLLWVVISPLLLIVIYGFVLTTIYKVEIEGGVMAYALLILGGLVPWMAFSEALGGATKSIVLNPTVVRNSPLPAIFLPTIKALQAFVALLLSVVILVVIAACTDRLAWHRLPVVPYAFVNLCFFSLGAAYLCSSVSVYVRDVIQLISTILLLGLFGSPVLFTPEMIEGLPHFVHVLVAWNPITPFLGLFRACLVDTHLLWRDIWLAPVWAALSFGFGTWIFRRLEPGMADCLWS